MKKILFLLLFTVSIYGQTLQNPTFGIVTEKNNATDSTPAYFTTSQVDGVHKKTPAALVALKSDLPASYAVIVYVNATNPNSATIFDDVNPPTTNDNAFKSSASNLYIGTDGSTWFYNGSTYVTKTIPASSNFKIVGTGVDAGSNKTSSIYREGSIGSDGSIGSNTGYYVNRNGSNTAQIGGFTNYSNAIGSNSMMFQLNASNGLDLWNYASSTWNKRFTFSSAGNFTAATYNNYYPANEDGTILYHSTKWFTPTGTISTIGTTATSSSGQFNSTMVGAKLTINGEPRIITGYTSTTVVIVASAYSQNYSAVVAGSWGVYSRFIVTVGTLSTPTYNQSDFYGWNGVKSFLIDGDALSVDIVRGSSNNVNYNTNQAIFGGNRQIVWKNNVSGLNEVGGTNDLGLRRNTAGVLEIYDGVTSDGAIGNRRDLLARNYTGSATLTGTPTAPTATLGTNTTQIATTAFVQAAATSNIAQTITNGVTTSSPSQDVVFDALNTKANLSGSNFTGGISLSGTSNFIIGNGTLTFNSTGNGLYGPNNGAINFLINHPSTPGWTANTNITATFYKTTVYTVATLPTTGVASGTYATVSDALAPTYMTTVVGGGTVVTPVFYNGTSWVAH